MFRAAAAFVVCLSLSAAVCAAQLLDFPRELRQKQPVADITQAAVYTMNEFIDTDYGMELARKVGSDVLIRGWFKWNRAHDYAKLSHFVPQAHALGALFGGGVTCSALYDGENGLSPEQVKDLATRGADGNLVNAWGHKGVRHGTLSNPKYLDYIFLWCQKQIDAGAQYLFMDEIDAALGRDEGFDDYSNRDFRDYLVRTFCQAQSWSKTDARWSSTFKIDLADKALAPDGAIDSFDYRAYLKKHDAVQQPRSPQKNPLAQEWYKFRAQRDDRAWRTLTTRIRDYAQSKGHRVYISGNGIAKYVDLQVLGVWGLWRTTPAAGGKGENVDFEPEQMLDWAGIVRTGRAVAGKRVPVVLFHDWGMNGFPYQKVPTPQRNLWNRIRGAEIYAAGGFYAFPVHGPFGCDAKNDGTLAEIARQTRFYQQNRALYLAGELLSVDSLKIDQPLVSASLWKRDQSPALIVHVVNRKTTAGTTIDKRRDITLELPTGVLPKSITTVSPDWDGPRTADAKLVDGKVKLVIPEVEAYVVAVLQYESLPPLNLVGDRIVLTKRWERPETSEFIVDRTGAVDRPHEINGVFQGQLHADMDNPPTFTVHARGPARLWVKVQSVATMGGRLECVVDGNVVKAVDLPDRDRKNDMHAPEYDDVIEFILPPGKHRVTLRNTGKDWLSVAWLRFGGELE